MPGPEGGSKTPTNVQPTLRTAKPAFDIDHLLSQQRPWSAISQATSHKKRAVHALCEHTEVGGCSSWPQEPHERAEWVGRASGCGGTRRGRFHHCCCCAYDCGLAAREKKPCVGCLLNPPHIKSSMVHIVKRVTISCGIALL